MFQYAFAYAISRMLDADYGIIDHSGSSYGILRHMFRLPVAMDRYRKLLSRMHHYDSVVEVSNTCDPLSVLQGIRDGTVYCGYFQSSLYFDDWVDDIRSMFRVRRRYAREPSAIDARIKPPYLAVHVRRGDYLDWNLSDVGLGNPVLSDSYYQEALRYQISGSQYFRTIVLLGIGAQDLMDVTREYSPIVVSGTDVIEDFQIIAKADGVICSNSSYAWWAAFLNERGVKVAPANWLGHNSGIEYPKSVIPSNWAVVECVK